jgi:hypothetical protein
MGDSDKKPKDKPKLPEPRPPKPSQTLEKGRKPPKKDKQ